MDHVLPGHYRARVASARSSGLLRVLVDTLFDRPAITIPQAARRLGVTHRAARLNVDKLVKTDILVEVGDRRRNKLFMAPGVLRAVDDLPEPVDHDLPEEDAAGRRSPGAS